MTTAESTFDAESPTLNAARLAATGYIATLNDETPESAADNAALAALISFLPTETRLRKIEAAGQSEDCPGTENHIQKLKHDYG